MKLGRVVKQLRREMLASPKKAAVMGLLALVALYFWAPLLLRWVHPTSGAVAEAKPEPPKAVAIEMPTDLLTKPKSPAAKQHTWQDLVRWLDADERTKPAAELAQTCNPFRIPRPQSVQHSERPKVVDLPVSPQSVGLALSSTIVGQDRRVARLNGKTYAEGRRVEVVTKDGRKLAFILVEIEPRRVLLERLGMVYELTIRSPGSSGSIELLGSVN